MSDPAARSATLPTASAERRAARTSRGEGKAYWFYGHRVVIRTPDEARPIVIEETLPPGSGAPLHLHQHFDDSFYLESGRIAMRCGADTFLVRAGDYVSLPAGVPHTFMVLGDQPAVMIQTHSETDFLDFIRAAGTPGDQAPPDMASLDFAALNEVAGQTGQPVLGPPMTAEEATQIAAG